jgi:hypothetical protein
MEASVVGRDTEIPVRTRACGKAEHADALRVNVAARGEGQLLHYVTLRMEPRGASRHAECIKRLWESGE